MSIFSFRPAFTLRGRQFHGLRGWDGMPSHPPLVHFPISAYIFAALFAIISEIGRGQPWGHDAFVAAVWVMAAGFVVSVLTALTGLLDWLTTQAGTQVRRTAHSPWLLVVAATPLALLDPVLAPRRDGA